MLLALEVAPVEGHGARLRMSLTVPGGGGRVRLSDLLLLDTVPAEHVPLEALAARALASDVVPGARVGVYWETYGLRPTGEPVAVTLSAERIDTPLLRRAAEAMGLADRATPLNVRWQEQPDARTGIASRAMTVDLSSLAPGRYRLRLTTTPVDGPAAVSERTIVIAR